MESNKITEPSLMSGDTESGKELFLKYGGNHFQMQREGEYERYKAFGISKTQEIRWEKERRNVILHDLESRLLAGNEFIELVEMVIEYADTEGLCSLLDLVNDRQSSLDTFTMLNMAEALFRIYTDFRSRNVFSETIIKCRNSIGHLLKMIDEQEFSVDLSYQKIPYLSDVLNQEKICERTERLRASFLQSV